MMMMIMMMTIVWRRDSPHIPTGTSTPECVNIHTHIHVHMCIYHTQHTSNCLIKERERKTENVEQINYSGKKKVVPSWLTITQEEPEARKSKSGYEPDGAMIAQNSHNI